MVLYKRIKERRESLNMSQDELAKKLGYRTRSTIARIESGENDLNQSKIVAFAKALDTTPGYLMGWSEAEQQTDIQSVETLDSLFNMLSDKGKRKLSEYMLDLQNNPDNIDPNKFVKDIFINGLSEEISSHRKEIAKKIRMHDKLEKSYLLKK